jgi:hypothetical protein
MAFAYEPGGIVKVNPSIGASIFAKAKLLYDACGLGSIPTLTQKGVDNRWNGRQTAWTTALNLKSDWLDVKGDNTPNERKRSIEHIKIIASMGYFSVLMAVFVDEPEIKKALILQYKGTASDCFDADGNAVHRPGGEI